MPGDATEELFDFFDQVEAGAKEPQEEYPLRSSEKTRQVAAEKGLVVKTPEEDELFIDIDNEDQFSRFLDLYNLAQDHNLALGYNVTPSASGFPHRHIRVTLAKPAPAAVRVALQAAMGSDPKRELLTVRRILENDPEPIMFFEKPGEGEGAA